MAVLFVQGSNSTIYGNLIEDFRTRYSMGHCEYPKKLYAAVGVMCQIKNTRNNMVRKNKYENRDHNFNQDNDKTRNDSSFAQTSKRRFFCCG